MYNHKDGIDKVDKVEKEPYSFEFDKKLGAMVCKVTDPKKMFPFYLYVDEIGLYKINQNKTGKIQMSK